MAVAICFFVVGVLLGGISCHPDAARHVVVTEAQVGIYGGQNISIQQAPYMASLRHSTGSTSKHWCGASIIHKQFVLTAAHCVHPTIKLKVLVGTANATGNGGELIDIERTDIHPKFNSTVGNYDFCVIKLKKPVTFSTNVSQVKLSENDDNLHDGTMLNVTGWGTSESEYKPKMLRQVEIPLYNWSDCKKIYQNVTARLPYFRYTVTPEIICAGKDGRDACQGDSGGPLTLGDVQVGVTSWGYRCAVYPGVFAKVSSVKPWIMKKIKKYST